MKRLLKSWVFWAFVGGPAVVVLLQGIHRQQRVYLCGECLSERADEQWRIGWERRGTLPLWPRSELQMENRVYLDGWAGAHHHRWSLIGQSAFHTPGANRDRDGLLSLYESRPAFRAFMLAKRDRGEVSREHFMATLENPYLIVCYDAELPHVRARRERLEAWRDEFDRRNHRP